jgi:hypothetical protein
VLRLEELPLKLAELPRSKSMDPGKPRLVRVFNAFHEVART